MSPPLSGEAFLFISKASIGGPSARTIRLQTGAKRMWMHAQHAKTQPEKSRTALIAKVSQSAAAVVFHPPLAVGRCPVTRFCRPLAYKVRGHDIRESTSGLLLCKCRRKYRRLAHTPGHLTQRVITAGFWDYYISLPAPMSTGFQSFSSEESSSNLGVSAGFGVETITFVWL